MLYIYISNAALLKAIKCYQGIYLYFSSRNIYFKNKNYKKALEKFEEARTLFDMAIKPQNRLNGLNTSNSNIGLVYGAMGQYDKQEEIFYKVYDNIVSSPLENKGRKNYNSTVLYSMSQILSVKLLKGDVISAENKSKRESSNE